MQPILPWLLAGDVAIQYQVHRDLLGQDRPDLRQRVATEGWGKAILARQDPGGHWGSGYYQPKWTSTHYTLLDLRNLELPPDNPAVSACLGTVMLREKGADGGINPSGTVKESEVCIIGMALNFACHFGAPLTDLTSIVDFILAQAMPDGGWNCRANRSGAVHSSLHSTVSVLEGLHQYRAAGHAYRLDEIEAASGRAIEFLLVHQLFLSDRTGAIIDPKFLHYTWPWRWHYSTLRALDLLRLSGLPYDPRLEKAFHHLLGRRGPDGLWKLQSRHAGEEHVVMEKAGLPSRWITLIALRVLRHFRPAELAGLLDAR